MSSARVKSLDWLKGNGCWLTDKLAASDEEDKLMEQHVCGTHS